RACDLPRGVPGGGVGVRRRRTPRLPAGGARVLGRQRLPDRERADRVAPRGDRGAARGPRGDAQPVGGPRARRHHDAAADRRAHPATVPRPRERGTAGRDGGPRLPGPAPPVPARVAARSDLVNAFDVVLWVAIPYATIAVFVVGHIW